MLTMGDLNNVRVVYLLCVVNWCLLWSATEISATPAVKFREISAVNNVKSVCDMVECNCTNVFRTKWFSITCQFDPNQVNFLTFILFISPLSSYITLSQLLVGQYLAFRI